MKRTIAVTTTIGLVVFSLNAQQVKDLGAGREVMWDMDRISVLSGGAKLTLHHPQQREIALVHDAPWEGNVCCYHTVLRDDTNYKMYYRGSAWNLPGYKNHQVVCYAERIHAGDSPRKVKWPHHAANGVACGCGHCPLKACLMFS